MKLSTFKRFRKHSRGQWPQLCVCAKSRKYFHRDNWSVYALRERRSSDIMFLFSCMYGFFLFRDAVSCTLRRYMEYFVFGISDRQNAHASQILFNTSRHTHTHTPTEMIHHKIIWRSVICTNDGGGDDGDDGEWRRRQWTSQKKSKRSSACIYTADWLRAGRESAERPKRATHFIAYASQRDTF